MHFKAAKLLAALAVAGLAQQALAAPPAPNALPTGGKVLAGTAAISQAGSTMNINQSSQRAVINWNSFDVGSQATVNFNQPNTQAATLNYVNSASKSMINGAVNANGQVIFVNNNGVVFGKGAEVNVGGMVATTMNTSAQEFMDGKAIQTFEGGTTGKVINKGNITGNNINSYIALMAPQVVNTGVITATMSGNNAIALVAGQKVTLKFSDSQFVSVSVDASVVNALISNKLLINAGNGQVIIGANAAQNLMGSLIKNTGTVSANGINTSGGKISLTADNIEQSGTVEANSVNANGGQVNLAANNINLASGSKTTATGATGGGNITVGVNVQNAASNIQAAVQNNQLASTVSVQANAIVDASATQNGSGGNISIWSQIKTFVAGSLFAKGGAQGGNGGFIETSSKGSVVLAATTQIDTSAPKGKTGTWTIDPVALIVDSTSASVISNALNTTSVTLDATGNSCAFGACTQSQTPLIQILADIYSGNTNTALNLIATGGQIDINANVTAGQVYAVAQAINVNGSINTNGGSNSNIYLAGAIINILGNINSNGSNSGSNNSNNTNSSNLNSVNTTTANNRRNSQNGLNADQNTYTSNGGLINILATGDITVGANSYISANGINGGVVTVASTAGKVTINGIVDSIGKSNIAGNIMIAGKAETNLVGSLIGVEGLNVGGMINLGQINNLGNGTILAPPATAPPALITFVQDLVASAVVANHINSITSNNINLDSQTGINAPNGNIVVFGDQISVNNSNLSAVNGVIAIGREGYSTGALAGLTAVSNSTLIAHKVETSGNLLGTNNNQVLANEWLLDPTNVTIAAGGTSTGGSLTAALATAGAITIANTDIVSVVNGGGTVNVVYTGTMTQTGILAFAPTSGKTGTLILNNLSGTMGTSSAVTITGGVTNSGAGTVNLNIYSNGLISVNGNITSTAGLINIALQSTNQSTTNAGVAANITINSTITTRGGYLVIDATGGTINGLGTTTPTITRGTDVATSGKGGKIMLNSAALISTTTTGAAASATTTGGNFVAASSGDVNFAGGVKADIGGSVNLAIEGGNLSNTGGSYGLMISTGAGYLNSTGSIYIDARTPWSVNTPVFIQGGSINSFAGSLTILSSAATSVGGFGPFYINGPIAAYGSITLTSDAVGNPLLQPTMNATATGTITSTAGLVSITTTSAITGIYSAKLAGLISAPKVEITATNSTAGGLGLSMVGSTSGVTITADPTGVIAYPTSGNALSVSTTVGTSGQAGGITITGGAITNQSNGGSVSFVTNGDLTETSAVNFSTANTSSGAQTITYDTRPGNATSQITTGPFTYNAAGATKKVNYVEESNGSNLTIGNSATSAIALSGYILVDNTNSGALTPSTTPTATNMTTLAGVTAQGALTAGDYISLSGINNSSTVNAVALGATTLTVTSASTAAQVISVIGYHNSANIGNPGIASTGAVNVQSNGGSVLYKSNGSISQSGQITVAQNTTADSVISFDTTTGNKLATINAGTVVFNGTSTKHINYNNLTSGAQIVVNSALVVPGSITFDNTYLNGVQGGINVSNAWQYGTTTALGGIPITASLTANYGIYIRGVVGSASATTAATVDAVSISGATLTTTGTFTAGTDAINIVGIVPVFVAATTAGSNAIKISGAVAINNNSTLGNTNLIAYTGHYNDVVTITNASTAGAIEVSAIGTTANIITVAGTLFTQNSNAGVFIASSNNGNVTPPKIVNNGTGPVVIEAGAYLAIGTVNTACSATDCGQITAINGNSITSASGNVYLYAGSPGTTAVSTTTPATLTFLNPSLGTLSFSNTLFGQAYAAGNIPATLIPLNTFSAINTANVAAGTGGTSWNTGSIVAGANTGPVIQFRIQPSVTANVSAETTKVYGTTDPLFTAGNINSVGSLDYQLSANFVKTSANPGYINNGVSGCTSSTGCMGITVNSLSFVLPLTDFINSIYATPSAPRIGYGTLAGEQVNGSGPTTLNSGASVYTYNLSSQHGVLVSSGVTVNIGGVANTPTGLIITPAPLTITASNQSTQAGSAASLGTTAFTTTGLASVVVDGVTLTDAISAATLTASTYASPTYAAGTYPIVPSSPVFVPVTGSNGASNYAITYTNGTLTASSNAIVTITAIAESKVYGNSVTTNGVTYNASGVATVTIGGTSIYTISGLPVGDTLTGLTFTSLGGISTASVGSNYQIIPSGATITGSVPYTLNYVPALMTVTPRPITITATPVTTTYGTPTAVSQAITTGYTVTSGTVASGDAISSVAVNYVSGGNSSTTVPGNTGAATYAGAIVPSAATGTGGFNASNYTITYTPANLVVNPLAVTITANAQSTTYGTALALGTTAYTTSLSSLPNGDTISSVSLNYNAASTVPVTTNAATYSGGIIASGASGTGGFNTTNYAITYAPGNLTVTPANVVITPVNVSASGQTVVYNGATQAFNPATGFTVTGMQNSQALVFGTSGLASGLNIGTYVNTITTSGSNPTVTGVTNGGSLGNYSITVASQGSLTIIPAPLTITGATTSVAYNGGLQNNAAPSVVGLVGVDLASGNGVTVTGKSSGTNAGTYADTLSVAANGATLLSNYTVTKTNGALTITQLAATITGATTVHAYTGALQTNTYTTSGILPADLASAAAITIGGVATATHVSQGTVPDAFAVSGTASGNYAFTYLPGSITITPVTLTVTGANTTQVYNATAQTNTAATVAGLKGSDTATIGGAYGVGTHVGTYSDHLTVGLSNPSDYTVNVTNGSITITPATITIGGVTANNKVYNATTAATLNIGTITYAGVYPGDSVTVNASNLTGTFADKNVGTAKTVTISGIVLTGTSSADYQLSGGANTTTTANITPAPLTITGANLTTTYNASAQALAAPTVSGLIAGDNVVVAGGAAGTNAGTYTAAYTATGVDAGNYTVTANAPVLTINKASLVVTANNAGTFYGQTDPTLTATVSGLQGSDTSAVISPAYTVTRAAGTAVNTYAITAAGPSSSANYNITYAPGVFTISPAGVLVITMNSATTTYGTLASPTIASVQYASGTGTNTTVTTLTTTNGTTYSDTNGYSITINPSITSTGVTPAVTGASTTWNVGGYTNAVSNTNSYTQSGSPFTGVSTIANTLTITPAPLTLTVASVSKTYDANAVTSAQIIAGSLTGGVATGVTVTGGALKNSQTIAGLGGLTYSGSAIGAINASGTTYPIIGSVGSGFSNYNVTIVNGALTVNQAPLVVNGAVTTTPYNGASQTNAPATVSGLQGSDSVVVTGYATGTHANSYADTLVASGASASNYSITYNNGSMTITPASLLVTGAVNQYAYNGALQTNTGASVSGLKGSDTAAVSGYATATHVSQGIVPDALVATLSNPADYAVTYVQGSLQITPIVITAAVNTATVMYNAASQTSGFVVTGLKGTDTATAASGTATGTNVGTYTSNLVLTASSDYTIGAITNGTLTITPAPLTISAGLTANNKVYDATTAATIAVTGNQTLAGILGTDAISVSSTGPYTGATFSQSNVGSGLTVTPATTSTVINGVSYTTMAGVTLTGAAANNYYVVGVGPQTLTANITPKPITITTGLTASDKVYDGTTAATITSATQTLSGVLPADAANVSVSSSGPYTGVFSQSNVGSNLTVTPSTTATTIAGGTYNAMSGATLTGSAAGNYYVTGTTTPITANITPYIIDPLATTGPRLVAIADNKVYTSTNTANGTLAMAGLFGTDSVSVSYTGATFASPNVANGITVTFAGVTLSGASASNYQVSATATAPANITPAPLTITAIDKASFYTQPIVDLSTAFAPAVGLLGSDTVTGAAITTTATNTSAVNTYPISISAATGTGLSNYSITYVPATYTIIGPGGLLISTAGRTTPYGTGTSGNILAPALPTATYTTAIGSSISTLTYVSSSTTGNVTSYVFKDAANVTVTFDLTPANTSTSGSGNINIGSYPYATSNLSAGTTGLTSAIPSGNFTVTPLAVTLTATSITTAYNGATQTQPTATASPAILTGDTVTVSGAASGKDVGIYGSNLAAGGADASNYSFTYANANLTITPFVIGSGGSGGPSIAATANNKVYDATTVASGALAMTNLFAGDIVNVGYTSAAFAGPNVANGQTVSFAGVTLSGPAAANYAVATTPTATANITPAPLTISAGLTANNKVYDTNSAATIAVTGTQTLAGVLGTDVVSVSSTGPYTGATFSQSNVGAGLTVTPATSVVNGLTTMTGVTLTGAAANNYYVVGVGPQTLTANITPAPLTIRAGLTANNKVYDSTTAATISSATQVLAGVLGTDAVSVSSSGPYAATFASPNVANGIVVTANTTPTVIAGGTYNAMSGVTLTGAAAGNYYVTGTSAPITANITPYIITPGATTGPRVIATADNKVYTSTNTANGTLAMAGLFGTDTVAISYTGATFASPNVANGITVTFAGVTLSGPSASNYQVSATATAPANITPAPLTVTANDQASLYTQSLGGLSVASSIGLLGGQTITGATLSTTAATSGPNSSAGTYPISISAAVGAHGFSANNYVITYVPATYTIVPAGQLMVSTSGLTTVYGSTVVSGNIVPPSVHPTLSYLTTSGTVIPNSSFTWQSQTVVGNVVTYTYSDGSGHTVTFNLSPTATTTSSSGNINVGSYGYAASNISAPGAGLTSTTGVATGDLVVTPLAVTITAPTVSHAYNGTVQTQPVATASPAILTNDVVTIAGAASGKNVGVYGSNLSVTGVDSTNYSITLVNANLTITPFIIGSGGASGPSVVVTANNKVYDTTTAATGTLAMTNLFPGDSVLANYGSAAFATANVNALTSPQTVTFSALTLSGAAAGNYAFATSTLASTASITPAPVTINGLTAQNKVYTSTTAATVTGTPVVTGLLGNDSSTATGTVNGLFASPNVANGIAVAANLSGLTLSNSNYYITGVTTPLTANITPAPLTISSGLSANSKVYDTTNAATIGVTGAQTLAGVLGSDAANLSVNSSGPYTGTFSQTTVGVSLTVTPATTTTVINGQNYTTMSGASLSGSAAGNYYIAGVGPQTLTADITKAPLTITANNQASFVTQNIGSLSYSQVGLLGSDAIGGVTQATTATSSSAANTYPITVSAATGAAMANYQITYVPGTYTIVPAGQVLITTTGTSTVYGTAPSFANPTVAYATSGGTVINPLSFVSSVTVNGVTTYTYSDGLSTPTVITFNFAPVNPVNSASGNLSVKTYGLSAANFTKTGTNVTSLSAVVSGDLTVTPRPVTISAIAATYQYNASTRNQLDSISSPGIIAGDAVAINGLASGKNVGTYGSGLAVSGADTKDYLFTLNNANLTITPYVVNFGAASGPAITATANSRVYNTTTIASGALAMTNLFPGDVVNVGYASAAFYNANVGSAKTVTFNGVTLSGPAAANYAVGSGAITASANITPAPVTISGLLAANKQYDGNTKAVVSGSPLIAGLLGSDTSTLTGTVLSGVFAASNPGKGIGVTANLTSLVLGNSNYYIAGVTFPLTAEITSPPQTINNMAVVQQQVAQEFVPERPSDRIKKGELIYVRDKDDLKQYMQAIEVPSSGAFKFPVPDQIIQDLINLSGENVPSTQQAGSYKLLLLPKGSRLVVTLPDGAALPAGIKYDAASKNFTVPKLGEVTLPLSVKVTLMRGNKVLSQKIMVVTK